MYAIYIKGNSNSDDDRRIGKIFEYFEDAADEMRELFNIYYNEYPSMASKLQVVDLLTGKVVY